MCILLRNYKAIYARVCVLNVFIRSVAQFPWKLPTKMSNSRRGTPHMRTVHTRLCGLTF